MSPKRKGPGGARKGAGRPSLGARSAYVAFKVTAEKLAEIEAASVAAGLSRSAWICAAIDAALGSAVAIVSGSTPLAPALTLRPARDPAVLDGMDAG